MRRTAPLLLFALALVAARALPLPGQGRPGRDVPTAAGWRAIAQTAIRASIERHAARPSDSLFVLDTVSTLRNIRERAGAIAIPFGASFDIGRPAQQGTLSDVMACPTFSIDNLCRFTRRASIAWIGVPLAATATSVRLVVHVAFPRGFDEPGGNQLGILSTVIQVSRDAQGQWSKTFIERFVEG